MGELITMENPLPHKVFFSYQTLHKTLQNLAQHIKDDNYHFDALVAIASGGFVPARILKSYFNLPLYSVNVSYYDDNDERRNGPRILQWLNETSIKITGKNILLIDEIDDSRSTLAFTAQKILEDKPKKLVVAVMHNKLVTKKAQLPPEVAYYAGDEIEDVWAVYPWEAEDIEEHYKLIK
jgi:hypoxanthine phosphoribosyltransferase